MPQKSRLGRGLGALIPGGDNVQENGVMLVPVEMVSPNPRQPRHKFDPDALRELADSHGRY